ncbi:branched-chain amino acid ABC transporter permease [Nitratifractor sp.]|uniref:branched-chain amino acid ABC transporter permease n=1 Tax=Nitratifractor sp. TaxID=2268144 RepID=UPI0025D08F7D|nr:branched-chain amino acid ABC transporter permease [Nitratifractor sp.]
MKNAIIKLLLILLTLGVIAWAHQTLDSYTLSILNNIGIFAILALSYNLINGVTGQFSLEPNGFVAIGAYMTALFLIPAADKIDMYALVDPAPIILQMKANFLPAVLAGGIAATLVALLLSFPVFRVRGDYLAIVTLGFGFIIRIFALNEPAYTNGAMGLNDIPGIANFMWIGSFALVTLIVMLHIVYSKFGRAMKAVRDDEDAATAMGINTFRIKTTAFMTSAFFEGIGGGLLASFLTTITPDQFSFLLTFQLLIIIVLGGLGSMTGSLVATILVMGSMEWLRFLDDDMVIFGMHTGAHPGMRMVVFAILLIVMMLFARRGLFGDRELPDIFRKKFGKKDEA